MLEWSVLLSAIIEKEREFIMQRKVRNQMKLWLFCLVIGAFAGLVLWLFLKAVLLGTELVWEWIPAQISIPAYTIIICTVGGLVIGLFRKKFGNYPEELEEVLGTLKREKRYEYRNMLVLLTAAALPLILGSSVGPEAGMTGVIVGLCCWASENVKFAKEDVKTYSQVGMAVTLGVLFHSPLFGIFAVEEEQEGQDRLPQSLPLVSKLLLYGLALGAGTGVYLFLSALFGTPMEGFPSFAEAEPSGIDYPMMLVYVFAGILLSKFYELTKKGSERTADKLPPIVREMVGGLCLGVIGFFVPALMFSGEEQMGVLMTEYGNYLPWMLMAAAFLKVLLTNLCIHLGLRGGHFFPVIFAGVCLGYGIALAVFHSGGHVVIAAAVTTAALLGAIMKKPLAVTMLLFLCFPVKLFVWIFLGAVIGSKAA